MKIAYFVTKSEIGGAQTHLLKLIEHGVSNGHEIVLVSGDTGWLTERAKELGVSVYVNKYLKNSFNPINLLRGIKETKRLVKEINPDLIHLHSGAAGFITRLSVKGKIKTIFTAHGWSFTDGTPILRRIIALISEKLVSKYADKIVCVSKNDYDLALSKGIAKEDKLVLIHNFVSVPREVSSQDVNEINILFVGRLAPPKDLTILFKAYKNLLDEFKQRSKIIVVGGGKDLEKYKKEAREFEIEEKVIFVGTKNHKETLNYFKSSQIFVLPTHWEGFPMTILEAMSHGIPTVASSVGGVKEVVDNTNGILADKNNQIKDFEKGLGFLIGNNEERKYRAINARKRIEEDFSLEKGLSKTFSLY